MNSAEFAGSGILTKFIIRRDRLFIPLWVLGMISLILMIPPALVEMFPTVADRIIMAETMKNPAMVAMCGPCYDYENYGNGAMYAQFMLVWCTAIWAVMNIFLVVRHTRKDEEEGRLEVIRSLPVGRQAALLSTINVVIMVNVIMSLITGLGLWALNIDDMDFAGSILFGVLIGVTGLIFAGVTLVFSQLCSNARGALGYPFAILGLSYVIRAAGDVSTEGLSFISPLGIICRTEVYVNNIWWPVIILVIISALLFFLAFKLNAKRDIEQGLIAAINGRSHASPLLGSTFGFTLKLLRSTLIAWAVTIYVLAAAYGSIFGDIEAFINSSDLIKQLFMGNSTANMTMQFVETLMVIMSIIATISVLMIVLKLRGEEKRGRLDDILARNVSRSKLLGSYVTIAVVFTVIAQCITALGLWSTAMMVMDNPLDLTEIFKSAMIYVPAMLVNAGLAATLAGAFPRATIIVWLYLGYSFFMDYIGGILDLPDWASAITPFGQTPRIPTEEFEILPISIMCGVAIVLFAVGFIGFRNRDIRQN